MNVIMQTYPVPTDHTLCRRDNIWVENDKFLAQVTAPARWVYNINGLFLVEK